MGLEIHRQRMTARMEGDFCVFLIGMRINRPFKIHRWLPVARAMTGMLSELRARPELGFLGGQGWMGRTMIFVQYWKSVDLLMEYAIRKDLKHLVAWKDFSRSVGDSGDVGIWHETYSVKPGQYENIYHNMPRFGLGSVGQLVPATGVFHQAAGRMDGKTE